MKKLLFIIGIIFALSCETECQVPSVGGMQKPATSTQPSGPHDPDITTLSLICGFDYDLIYGSTYRPTAIHLSEGNTLLSMLTLYYHAIQFNLTSLNDDICYVGTPDVNKTLNGISAPYGISFNPDGSKVYILDYAPDKIYEYPLSTNYDLSTIGTASYTLTIVITGVSVKTRMIEFSDDGLHLYIAEDNTDKLYQYDLSTAWDLSTASLTSNEYYHGTDLGTNSVWDIEFNSSGTKLYVSVATTYLYELDLSTAWDLSTASYNTVSIDIPSINGYVYGLSFGENYDYLAIITYSGYIFLYSVQWLN